MSPLCPKEFTLVDPTLNLRNMKFKIPCTIPRNNESKNEVLVKIGFSFISL